MCPAKGKKIAFKWATVRFTDDFSTEQWTSGDIRIMLSMCWKKIPANLKSYIQNEYLKEWIGNKHIFRQLKID